MPMYFLGLVFGHNIPWKSVQAHWGLKVTFKYVVEIKDNKIHSMAKTEAKKYIVIQCSVINLYISNTIQNIYFCF